MATRYIIKDTILEGYSDSPYSDGVEISDPLPEFDPFTHICKRIDNQWVLEEKDLTEWNATQYQRDREFAYPSLAEQFDLLWHAIDDGKFNVKSKETDFYKKLKAVKDANPKPE